MKQILLALVLIIAYVQLANSQKTLTDYDIEEQGYFNSPMQTSNGIVVTDNYCNTLYLIENGSLKKLISAPGVGRYFTVSPDKNLIGIKLIEKGKQTPAIYDLNNDKIIKLNKATYNCGQVSFANNGEIAFTIGNEVYIRSLDNKKTTKIDIGTYVNIVVISPDAKYLAYSNAEERITIFEIATGNKTIISEKDKMAAYPRWSPDSKKLLYQSERLFIWDNENSILKKLDIALYPHWTQDSEHIIYYKTKTDKQKLIDADIFITDLQGNNSNISNTPDEIEMQPVCINDNEIIYQNYNKREIIKLNINDNKVKSKEKIYKHEGEFSISHFNIERKQKAEVFIPGTAPYVHQVYDTPDWHYGYGSCAPATSIMAIEYYNLLPKWPEQVSTPYAHTSDYGNYVADKYTLNEIYYDTEDNTSGGEPAWGGYGYMWGNGSPNSYMSQYLINHYMTSNQFWSSSCTFDYTTAEIDSGFPHPLCVMLTASGHLILTIGYVVGQHTLIFNDPYGNKNTAGYPSYDGIEAHYDWPGYNNGYENLDYNGTYGGIAWSVRARYQETTYNDTLIDDIYYNHGFNINNSQNSSHMRYFHDYNAGYNNHMWYTYTMASLSDICWVTWEPTIAITGNYEVSAYIPSVGADAVGARYQIHHANGDDLVLIDQSQYSDEWVSLGNYEFDAGQTSWVYLGDSTGIGSQAIAFDAVKWSYMPVPTIDFNANLTTICEGETIDFTNLTLNAVSYEWLFPGGNPASSTQINPSVQYTSSGNYNVSLIANGSGGSDTLEFTNYISVNASPNASFNAIETTIYLPTAIAVFNNTSLDANSYYWDFGNGNTSTDSNPYCIYNSAGTYTVRLIAQNGLCADDTLIMPNYINVLNPTGIVELNNNGVEIYPNPVKDVFTVSSDGLQKIEVLDVLGKKLYEINCNDNQQEININSFSSDIENQNSIILKVTNSAGKTYNKLIISK